METAGHLAPHWRDPTLDPAGRRWQSDMKDEAQKWTSTGTEKTKPCFSLLPHYSSSLKTVSATLLLLWQKQPNWKRDSAFSLTFLQSMRLTLYMCLFFTKLTYLNLNQFHTDEGKTAKDNLRHLRKKLQEETYLCAFPAWELSSIEEFWCFMRSLAARFCVHCSSSLASPCFSVFLHFFFLKEIFVGRVELELE